MIEGRRKITALYNGLTKQGVTEDFTSVIKFLSWKFNYLRKNVRKSLIILIRACLT